MNELYYAFEKVDREKSLNQQSDFVVNDIVMEYIEKYYDIFIDDLALNHVRLNLFDLININLNDANINLIKKLEFVRNIFKVHFKHIETLYNNYLAQEDY